VLNPKADGRRDYTEGFWPDGKTFNEVSILGAKGRGYLGDFFSMYL